MSPLLASEQTAKIACVAEGRATAMFGYALCGVAKRIPSATMPDPVVMLPLLHKADIAARSVATSSGKVLHVTGGAL